MVAGRPGVSVPVKYEVVVDGRVATLAANGERFEYRGEDGTVTGGDYSIVAGSVLINGRSYAVSALGGGEFSVNGVVFHVEVFDPRSLRGRRGPAESSGPQAVTTPMPGRVIRVLVEAGQEVAAGEGLIVVEAMKMQNEMKSPRAGRVAGVKTADGATVSAGDVLVVIE